jgi:uncharacterized protein YbaA (DUF1428 family)
MAKYVQSFILPVPKKKMTAYKALVKKAAKGLIKHGALEYFEGVADGIEKGTNTSFPRSVKAKSGETVVLSYVVYKSRAHRDSVMAKVMNDEKMIAIFHAMPVDGMRMFWGGFKAIVSA